MTPALPLVVIQCRYNSTRLPGKALYPLAGLPMLVFLIRRLKSVQSPHRLILATTDRPEDHAVAAWGQAEGLDVVRGENDDVLARYIRCLEAFPTPAVVRITADNPLTDPIGLDRVLSTLASGQYDHVRLVDRFPCGAGMDGFTRDSLERIHRETRDPRHREHINAFYLDHPDRFRILELDPPPGQNRPDVSLTVDTLEDLERVRLLIHNHDHPPYLLSLDDAIKRFDSAAV